MPYQQATDIAYKMLRRFTSSRIPTSFAFGESRRFSSSETYKPVSPTRVMFCVLTAITLANGIYTYAVNEQVKYMEGYRLSMFQDIRTLKERMDTRMEWEDNRDKRFFRLAEVVGGHHQVIFDHSMVIIALSMAVIAFMMPYVYQFVGIMLSYKVMVVRSA